MINFEKLRQEFELYDNQREKLIKKSRDILKLSKQIIYAVLRDEFETAQDLIVKANEERSILDSIASENKKLVFEGSYKIAIQELVEALLLFKYFKTEELQEMNENPEYFVLGLADLPGEMVRKAVYLAGKGKFDEVVKIKDAVDMIYGELLKFDFRNNEIRRKVDGIKYDLRKLEDLVLDMKLRLK